MKAVIFDFDQTIADTSFLEPYRKNRKWSFVLKNISKIKPYPDICNIISHLSESGLKIGVVTTSPKFYCEHGLNFLGVKTDCIIGYHDVQKRKPAPDSILLAMRFMKSYPHETIGFGDTMNDILSYNSSKIYSVACLWGCDDRTSIINAQPTFILQAPKEILDLLKD